MSYRIQFTDNLSRPSVTLADKSYRYGDTLALDAARDACKHAARDYDGIGALTLSQLADSIDAIADIEITLVYERDYRSDRLNLSRIMLLDIVPPMDDIAWFDSQSKALEDLCEDWELISFHQGQGNASYQDIASYAYIDISELATAEPDQLQTFLTESLPAALELAAGFADYPIVDESAYSNLESERIESHVISELESAGIDPKTVSRDILEQLRDYCSEQGYLADLSDQIEEYCPDIYNIYALDGDSVELEQSFKSLDKAQNYLDELTSHFNSQDSTEEVTLHMYDLATNMLLVERTF